MADQVIVVQNRDFEIGFRALTEEQAQEAGAEFLPMTHIHELSPYGMLLASLGSCTTIVLHTYAQNHDVPLDEVEIHLRYERDYECEDCDQPGEFEEQIVEEITLRGELTEQQREKLFVIARHCSIHQMLEDGIDVESHAAEHNHASGETHRHG